MELLETTVHLQFNLMSLESIFPTTTVDNLPDTIFDGLENFQEGSRYQESEEKDFFDNFHVCESPDNFTGKEIISDPDPDGIKDPLYNENSCPHLTFEVDDIDM